MEVVIDVELAEVRASEQSIAAPYKIGADFEAGGSIGHIGIHRRTIARG
jgi:hypothetical protein